MCAPVMLCVSSYGPAAFATLLQQQPPLTWQLGHLVKQQQPSFCQCQCNLGVATLCTQISTYSHSNIRTMAGARVSPSQKLTISQQCQIRHLAAASTACRQAQSAVVKQEEGEISDGYNIGWQRIACQSTDDCKGRDDSQYAGHRSIYC
jgi:hypothetical protein